jgi:hypothetical protein
MQGGRLKAEAAKLVPWFIEVFRSATTSVCKGRWVEIRNGLKLCYAQWEDVGPFRTDDSGYVFGSCPPQSNANHGAGIDFSPAVRDFLSLGPLDIVDWKFVDTGDVSGGPWSECSNGVHCFVTLAKPGTDSQKTLHLTFPRLAWITFRKTTRPPGNSDTYDLGYC